MVSRAQGACLGPRFMHLGRSGCFKQMLKSAKALHVNMDKGLAPRFPPLTVQMAPVLSHTRSYLTAVLSLLSLPACPSAQHPPTGEEVLPHLGPPRGWPAREGQFPGPPSIALEHLLAGAGPSPAYRPLETLTEGEGVPSVQMAERQCLREHSRPHMGVAGDAAPKDSAHLLGSGHHAQVQSLLTQRSDTRSPCQRKKAARGHPAGHCPVPAGPGGTRARSVAGLE